MDEALKSALRNVLLAYFYDYYSLSTIDEVVDHIYDFVIEQYGPPF